MTAKSRFAILLMAGVGLTGAVSAQALNGAGATFPYPIYSRWFEEFRKANPKIEINYQSIGSGAGINQLTAGTVDFGASDVPMTDEQLGAIKIKPLHFPTVIGAVVPIYNISGNPELKFTPDVIAGIFMRKITKWNDGQIEKLNPGAKLPAADIIVVHRAEASGTTFVFSDFLSKTVAQWKSAMGANAALKWPQGTIGQKGNEAVAGFVKQTPNAIGYGEIAYAMQNKIPYAAVRNADGAFVKASLEGITAAAAGAAKAMPADFRVSITNAPGKTSYPIASFTWLLIPSHFADAAKKKALVDFLHWMLNDGQKDCASLLYAPLPKTVVDKELKQITQIQ